MAPLKCVDCTTTFDGEWDYYFAEGAGRCPSCEEKREQYGREQAASVRAAVADAAKRREEWLTPGETAEDARARKLDR